MITFQIVLTTVQIATLQCIQQQNDLLDKHGLKPGEFTKLRSKAGPDIEDEYIRIGDMVGSHYITSSRSLQREGLIRWDKVNGAVLTEKGLLTLRLIEMDVEQMRNQLSSVKRLKSVKKRA